LHGGNEKKVRFLPDLSGAVRNIPTCGAFHGQRPASTQLELAMPHFAFANLLKFVLALAGGSAAGGVMAYLAWHLL